MTVDWLTPSCSCFLRMCERDITTAGLSGVVPANLRCWQKQRRSNNRLDFSGVVSGAVIRVPTCRSRTGSGVAYLSRATVAGNASRLLFTYDCVAQLRRYNPQRNSSDRNKRGFCRRKIMHDGRETSSW